MYLVKVFISHVYHRKSNPFLSYSTFDKRYNTRRTLEIKRFHTEPRTSTTGRDDGHARENMYMYV